MPDHNTAAAMRRTKAAAATAMAAAVGDGKNAHTNSRRRSSARPRGGSIFSRLDVNGSLTVKHRQRPVPKTASTRALLRSALSTHFLFRGSTREGNHNMHGSSDVDELVGRMRPYRAVVDEVLFKQGEGGGRFYVVERGKVELQVEQSTALPGTNDAKVVCCAGRGDTFGELAILFNTGRAATARVVSAGIEHEEGRGPGSVPGDGPLLWTLEQRAVREFLVRSAEDSLARRCRFLRGIPLLRPLAPRTLTRLAEALKPRQFAAGEIIVRQGETGDAFYILDSRNNYL